MTAKRRTKNYIPVTVPFGAKSSPQTASRAGDPEAKPTREVSSWANRHVWTNRMLDALTVGVRGGRWHALIDKVSSDMNLYVSACKVVGKKGSAGVDRQSTEDFSASQMAEIKQLQEQLRSGKYRPQAVRRVRIPKPGSNQTRPLGIPTVRDRVVQTALVHVIEPIFDNEFHDRSFGFRHGRSCHDALQVVEELLAEGYVYVVDADLQSYFDTIPKDRLMQLIEAKISDRRLLGLMRRFLDQSILEDLQEWTPDAGVPQGAVLSPLLSNLYLNELDHRMAELGYEMVRYADDFVILCRSQEQAASALEEVNRFVAEAGLTLHPDKTHIVDSREKSFDFLGYSFRGKLRFPRAKSHRKLVDTIRRVTPRNSGQSLEATIAEIIQTLRFSPDGRVLATGGDDGTIDLWDVSAVVAAVEQMGLPDQQRTDANDSNVASISSLPKPRLIRTIKAFPQFGGSIADLDTALGFSHDGSLLTALSSDGKAKLWDLTTVPGKYQMDQVTEDLYGWALPANIVFQESPTARRLIKLLPDHVVKGDPRRFDRLKAVYDSDKGKWQVFGGVETWYDYSMVANGTRRSEVRLKLENSEGEEYEATVRRKGQFRNQSTRSYSVAFAPDDNSVLVGDYTLGATRLNLESGEAIRYPQQGKSAAYSPDGRLVALDHIVGISIRDVKTDKELYRLDFLIDSEGPISSWGGNLAFSPDGKYLAHVSGNRYTKQKSDLNVWRTSDFKKVGGGPLRQKEITMAALAFSPDSSRLFVGDYDGVVEIWNTSDWTQEDSMVTVTNQISSLLISSDGKRLVIGHWRDFTLGGSVRVWDLETKEFLHALGSSSSSVSSMSLSPDDRTLAVGRMDHNVVLWDMETGKRLQTIQAHSESVFGVAFSHDGNRLATLSTDGVLHIWDAKTCSEIEDDPENIDLLLMLGVEHWMQQRFVEGEKTFALVLELNQEIGHLSESRLAAMGRDLRGWMYSWDFWPTLKEATGNWPSFKKQPPQTVGTSLGEHVTLSAEVTEGAWSYQWFHNENPIEGATSPSLELANISAADFGSYRLEVLGQKQGPLYQKKCVATTFLYDERGMVIKGHLLRKVFLHLCAELKELEDSKSFRNDQPEMIGVVDSSETPTDFAIHYGQCIEGFVVPPKTGDYVFYVACGYESKLSLSSDDSEENYNLIAQVKLESSVDVDAPAVGYMQPRAWGEHPDSVSKPIRLEAGKRYAIKGMMVDGFKGMPDSYKDDHFAVTWQMPGDEPPKPGDPPIPGEYLEFELK